MGAVQACVCLVWNVSLLLSVTVCVLVLTRCCSSFSSSLDGTKLPASCPQSSSFIASADMSENCLDLVVYAPNGATNLDNVPVLVWIHGGSFVSGSASAPGLDARDFARANNVIVVVIQVRSYLHFSQALACQLTFHLNLMPLTVPTRNLRPSPSRFRSRLDSQPRSRRRHHLARIHQEDYPQLRG